MTQGKVGGLHEGDWGNETVGNRATGTPFPTVLYLWLTSPRDNNLNLFSRQSIYIPVFVRGGFSLHHSNYLGGDFY